MKITSFVGGFYQGRSRNQSFEDCCNLYPEKAESENSKNFAKLIGTPGLELDQYISPALGVGGRGSYTTSGDRFFIVFGNQFFERNMAGVVTLMGTLNTFSGTVSMVDNGLTIIIVDGVNGYLFTLSSNTFAQISDANFPNGVKQVCFKDGYYIVIGDGTNRFYLSNLNATNVATCFTNVLTSAVRYGVCESNPDEVKAIIPYGNEIFIFGTKTIEPFYNSGNNDFPFERNNGGIIEQGTLSEDSVQKIGNSIFFVGSSKEGYSVVYQLVGYQLNRISTHDIEYLLAQADYLTDVISYSYMQEGHYFYVLTILSLNKTFVYDATTKLWHRRASLDSFGVLNRHKSSYCAFFAGKHFISDFENNNLFILNPDYYTDNGSVIPRIRICGDISNENKNIIFHKIELECEKGVGLESGNDEDENPQIELSYSNNGGFNFNTPEAVSMGVIGDYDIRCIWRQKGIGRNRRFKFYSTASVKHIWINAYAEIEALSE